MWFMEREALFQCSHVRPTLVTFGTYCLMTNAIFIFFFSSTRNVHFKMSHLLIEWRTHSQRNMGELVMIMPQPLFNPKGKGWNI